MSNRARELRDHLEREQPAYYRQIQSSPVETEKGDAVASVNALADVLTKRDDRRFIRSPREYEGAPEDVDVVVHMGCHSVKTPVIIDAVLDIIDALGYTAVGLGGYNNCCGIEDLKRGNVEGAQRVDANRFENMAAFEPTYAIAECTSCHAITSTLSLGYRSPEFEFPSLIDFLADHQPDLEEAVSETSDVTIAFHDHFDGRGWMPPGQAETARSVIAGLPGTSVVELEHSLDDALPCLHAADSSAFPYDDLNEQILAEAAESGADRLLTFWHACQRSLLYYDHTAPVSVVNYATFIAERLGHSYRDPLREYIAAGANGDIEWIVEDARETFEANGISDAEAESVIEQHFGALSG